RHGGAAGFPGARLRGVPAHARRRRIPGHDRDARDCHPRRDRARLDRSVPRSDVAGNRESPAAGGEPLAPVRPSGFAVAVAYFFLFADPTSLSNWVSISFSMTGLSALRRKPSSAWSVKRSLPT